MTAFKNLTRITAGPVEERGLFQTARSAVRTFFTTRQRIVGVELSPKLHPTAHANVAKFRSEGQRCRTCHLVQPLPVEVLDTRVMATGSFEPKDADWTIYLHP